MPTRRGRGGLNRGSLEFSFNFGAGPVSPVSDRAQDQATSQDQEVPESGVEVEEGSHSDACGSAGAPARDNQDEGGRGQEPSTVGRPRGSIEHRRVDYPFFDPWRFMTHVPSKPGPTPSSTGKREYRQHHVLRPDMLIIMPCFAFALVTGPRKNQSYSAVQQHSVVMMAVKMSIPSVRPPSRSALPNETGGKPLTTPRANVPGLGSTARSEAGGKQLTTPRASVPGMVNSARKSPKGQSSSQSSGISFPPLAG